MNGDENRKYVNAKGETIEAKREVVEQIFDLKHFQNTKPPKWETGTPEERLARYLKNNPTGKRKLLKETRQVKHGGWWYVHQATHTGATIQFGNKYDPNEFFAPTLEEALQLFLDSKK